MHSKKTGRNDPCPCGSGKKYKSCCLSAAAQSVESPSELTWRRVRRALDEFEMAATLLGFVNETYGPATVPEAWEEFLVWPDGDLPHLTQDSPHIGLFMSWLFHAWAPDPHQTLVYEEALHDRVPTQAFLELHRKRLDPLIRRYLEACLGTPFSFHEILRCEPGQGFTAQDVFTGQEWEVRERGASQTLQPHDIIFGQLVPIDGIVMLESCSPFGLTPACKLPILDMRDVIRKRARRIKTNHLRDYDIELRQLYLSLTNRFLQPSLPELQNTDGEPLAPQRVLFEIDSPEGAFEALKHLARWESKADLASAIERDRAGNMRRAEIPWLKKRNARQKSPKNTVLGFIRIEGKHLTCEVNSVKRARKVRTLIESALGEHARYRATEIQSIERLLGEAQSGASNASPVADEDAALMARPEVQEHLKAMFAAHYEDWEKEKLPALGNQTPLEAVQTPGGRERVEALLVEIERRSAGLPVPPERATFHRLRQRLGLLGAQLPQRDSRD
jgi:hypothetical protein